MFHSLTVRSLEAVARYLFFLLICTFNTWLLCARSVLHTWYSDLEPANRPTPQVTTGEEGQRSVNVTLGLRTHPLGDHMKQFPLLLDATINDASAAIATLRMPTLPSGHWWSTKQRSTTHINTYTTQRDEGQQVSASTHPPTQTQLQPTPHLPRTQSCRNLFAVKSQTRTFPCWSPVMSSP